MTGKPGRKAHPLGRFAAPAPLWVLVLLLALALGACGEAGTSESRLGNGGAGGGGTAGTAGSDGTAGTAGSDGTGGTAGSDGAGGTAGNNGTGGTMDNNGTGGTAGGSTEDCGDGPLDLPLANCQPQPLASTGNVYADCVARINQLRWECQCLPPLQRWHEGESCADQHAAYDSTRSPHAGFRDGICSPGGWAQNECPGWGSNEHVIDGCLQSMWDEGPGEPYSVHGHYINMTNPSYTMVACGFHETAGGQVWSVQNFQ